MAVAVTEIDRAVALCASLPVNLWPSRVRRPFLAAGIRGGGPSICGGRSGGGTTHCCQSSTIAERPAGSPVGCAKADQCDLELVERVAREMVERHGAGAVDYLQQQAEIAAGIGDSLSARTWLDIAGRARDLLS